MAGFLMFVFWFLKVNGLCLDLYRLAIMVWMGLRNACFRCSGLDNVSGIQRVVRMWCRSKSHISSSCLCFAVVFGCGACLYSGYGGIRRGGMKEKSTRSRRCCIFAATYHTSIRPCYGNHTSARHFAQSPTLPLTRSNRQKQNRLVSPSHAFIDEVENTVKSSLFHTNMLSSTRTARS